MAEVIVVSAIVLTLLSSIYASYNKLYGVYSSRINYYDAVSIYELAYYRDTLIESNKMVDMLNSVWNNGAIGITINDESQNKVNESFTEKTILVYINGKASNVGKAKTISGVSPMFSDYIDYLSESDSISNFELQPNYLMIMERCNVNNRDDCKYGYLEIYDGSE